MSGSWSDNYKNATTFYVATSKQLPGLIKIGITKNHDSRLRNLNSHKLGNVDDWCYQYLIKLNIGNAGIFETKILSKLKNYCYPLMYFCKSSNEYSKEVVKANLDEVIEHCYQCLISSGYTELEIIRMAKSCNSSRNMWLTNKLKEYRRSNIPYPLVPLAKRIWIEFGILPNCKIGGAALDKKSNNKKLVCKI